MYSTERSSYRRVFAGAWGKHLDGQALDPLESIIVEVVKQHPEYHALLTSGEEALDLDFDVDGGAQNPFMHLGMHVGLVEQLSTARPAGIVELYRELCVKTGDAHRADHVFMDCLADIMWHAQRNGQMPDENLYLQCVQKKIKTLTGKG